MSERKTREEIIAELDDLPPEEHVKRIEQARHNLAARIQARRERAEAAARRLREEGT